MNHEIAYIRQGDMMYSHDVLYSLKETADPPINFSGT